MTKSNFEKVLEFHKIFGVEIDVPITSELADFRDTLIWEEYQETCRELIPDDYYGLEGQPIDKIALTKELVDLLYVVYGTGVTFGLPLDEAFELVHQSNMSKLTKEGYVLRREDGKVLKSDQYKPADLSVLF